MLIRQLTLFVTMGGIIVKVVKSVVLEYFKYIKRRYATWF